MTSRPSTATPILAVLAVVLPMALYVVGYFALGKREDWPRSVEHVRPMATRFYQQQWLAPVFRPAAHAESVITGTHVDTASYEDTVFAPDPTRLP